MNFGKNRSQKSTVNQRTKTSPRTKKSSSQLRPASPQHCAEGNHGHAGLIVEATKYLAMAGTAFTISPNPGIYPAGLATNATAGTRYKK